MLSMHAMRTLFTYALLEEEVVLVNARLAVIGRLPPMQPPEAVAEPSRPRPSRRAGRRSRV